MMVCTSKKHSGLNFRKIFSGIYGKANNLATYLQIFENLSPIISGKPTRSLEVRSYLAKIFMIHFSVFSLVLVSIEKYSR